MKSSNKYQERIYRNIVKQQEHLTCFKVIVKETDLLIYADKNLEKQALDLVLQNRQFIENYILRYPYFLKTLSPWFIGEPAPNIINDMSDASIKANVGPMAAVAGVIAEHIAKKLLQYSNEIIVENGGDLFIQTASPIVIGIYAGKSPLSMKIGLRFNMPNTGFSVCTSSGTIGHSLSLGKADAVCVVSFSGAIADAAATSIANQIKLKSDLHKAVNYGKNIQGVIGLVAILDDKIGLWGQIDLVKL